ncbi:MAG: DMT family transporter [Bacteroidetes bacterium]|nr:DMT family transporter [Bacteroidota bacterium]MBS1630053.1 DMT family transporter [Bacteroidota bacterium]
MKKALLAMHAAVLLWGFTGVLGRAITLDFPILVWWRMLLTAFFIAIIISWRRHWLSVARKDQARLVLVGILMGIHWVAFYGAIKFANASVALVCLSTASIFTSLFDPFINDSRWNLRELGIGMLALGGVAVMYLLDDAPNGAGPLREAGILLGIVAAIISSIFTVLNKSIAAKYPARLMVFWEMSSGWVFISLAIGVALAAGGERYLLNPSHSHLQFLPIDAWDWLWVVVLALCCTVWAQSLALTALKKLSAFTSTLSVNLEPVYGILLAFLIFKENRELGAGFYIGLSLILLSVVLQMGLMLHQNRSSQSIIQDRGGMD